MPTFRDRMSRRWETASPWIVGVLAVLFVVSVVGNFVLQYDANKAQNNHHALTVQLLHEVLTAQSDHAQTLNEVHTLAVEFKNTVLVSGLALTAGQNKLEAQIQALCIATGAACP